MTASPRTPRACPASAAPGFGPPCPERPGDPACLAGPAAALLPRDGAERAIMLALRYVAAAAETGDAACFDAAFDGAEAAFGPRDGALLVARAAALVRALRRDAAEGDGEEGGGAGPRFLPPPCRRLSAGEARILAALRPRPAGVRGACPAEPATSSRAALADLVDLAALVRSAAPGLPAPRLPPRLPSAASAARPTV